MTDMRGNQPKSPTARRETRTLKITFRRFTALYDVARVTGYWFGGYFHAQLHHGWSRQVPAVTHE